MVINGSPKKENSDTMHITRAFLEGMNDAGENEVRILHAVEQNVHYCTGCFSCMRGGGKCVQSDDMQRILAEILRSDLLILSFPLYYYGMPAPLKAIVDRLLPLCSMRMERTAEDRYVHPTQADISHLRFMMICGCGFPNSRQNFEPAEAQFRLMFPGENPVITVPESPLFNALGADVVTVPRLELIRQAGRSYAKTGTIAPELLTEIDSPMIPEEVYAQIVNSGC